MSVIALVSAKGSPGVTMTALALASVWPERVALADIDPAGGDLIWRTRTEGGDPLDPDRGLLALGAATRRGAGETALVLHLQETSQGVPVLVGVPSPELLSGLGAVWGQLPAVFAAHHGDVIVDCGRVVPGSSVLPVLAKADAVVFVVRPDVEGIAQLRERLASLSGQLEAGRVGVIVRTTYRDTRSGADLQQLLDAHGLGAVVLGVVAEDEKGAAVLSSTRIGSVRRSLLGRSAVTLCGAIRDLVGFTAPVEVSV